MKLDTHTFYGHWSKDRNEQSQDACLYTSEAFAICDGVSQSFLPHIISQQVVRNMLPSMTGGQSKRKGMLRAKIAYEAMKQDQLESWEKTYPGGIPYHMIRHLIKGKIGSTTLLAGKFCTEKPELHIIHRGDCNILLFDHNLNLTHSIPYDDSNFPLVPEVISGNINESESLSKIGAVIPREGHVFVMSDAIARYVMLKVTDKDFISQLIQFNSLTSFRKSLLKWWKNGLEMDDITYLRYDYNYKNI